MVYLPTARRIIQKKKKMFHFEFITGVPLTERGELSIVKRLKKAGEKPKGNDH